MPSAHPICLLFGRPSSKCPPSPGTTLVVWTRSSWSYICSPQDYCRSAHLPTVLNAFTTRLILTWLLLSLDVLTLESCFHLTDLSTWFIYNLPGLTQILALLDSTMYWPCLNTLAYILVFLLFLSVLSYVLVCLLGQVLLLKYLPSQQ